MCLCTFTTDVYRPVQDSSTWIPSSRCVSLFVPCCQQLLQLPSVLQQVSKQDSVDWIAFCPLIKIHPFSSNIPSVALPFSPFLHINCHSLGTSVLLPAPPCDTDGTSCWDTCHLDLLSRDWSLHVVLSRGVTVRVISKVDKTQCACKTLTFP